MKSRQRRSCTSRLDSCRWSWTGLKKSPAYRVRAEAGMDFGAQRTERTAAVPLDGGFAIGMVLRGRTGDGREFEIDAVARRARIRGPCETGTPADAADGAGNDISEATAVGSRVRTQDQSVSAAQPQDRSAGPRLGQRYHLHPTAAGICLSGGDHGLVQPLCAGVGGI